jgi:hypothetical protein
MICPSCRTANVPDAARCEVCATPLSAARTPPRKGMAVASLVIGILSLPTLGLLIVGGVIGLVLGIVALSQAARAPETYGGKGAAIGGIVCSGLSLLAIIPLLIVAAIAIPGLLRARMQANESVAVGDIRTMIAAEETYRAMAGAYGPLECLAQPATCHPRAGTVPLIDASLVSSAPKAGYLRTFHAGPSAAIPGGHAGLSSFAYVVVPARPGRTGMRAFCGDSTGVICATGVGIVPGVVDGQCDLSTCSALD